MKNLCFSGGGLKGIAYLGVYKYLLEMDLLGDLENISGTSAGAIMSLFVVLKYSIEEIYILIEKLNYRLVESVDIKNLFHKYSIDDGKRIEYILQKILSSKGFNSEITFYELYKKTDTGLHICATRLDNCNTVIFNHLTTPSQAVFSACKYSMNIPFIWSSDKIDGTYYADGCLSENLPITIFTVEDTLGIYCVYDDTDLQINNIKDYITRSIYCCLRRANYFEIKSYMEMGYDLLSICIPKISNIDFDMSLKMKLQLIDCGYKAMSKKLKTNN